jgi:predicted nucleic acid-binding Zn ribbon protein
VLPLQHLASGVLAEIIRRQPASKAKTTFAWTVAVGPAIARATAVELDASGVLHVHARDPRWAREVERAAAVVLERLRLLLGSERVVRIDVCVKP